MKNITLIFISLISLAGCQKFSFMNKKNVHTNKQDVTRLDKNNFKQLKYPKNSNLPNPKTSQINKKNSYSHKAASITNEEMALITEIEKIVKN